MCVESIGIIDSFNDNPVAVTCNLRKPARWNPRRVAWLYEYSFHEFVNLEFKFEHISPTKCGKPVISRYRMEDMS